MYELCAVGFPETLDQGLRRHAASLQALNLDYTETERYDSHVPNRPLVSLQQFQQLTRLRIAVVFVFGGSLYRESTDTALLDILPRDLESLEFTKCEVIASRTCAAVGHLMRHRERFPRLSTIFLEFSESEGDLAMSVAQTHRRRLEPLAVKGGIQLDIYTASRAYDNGIAWALDGDDEKLVGDTELPLDEDLGKIE